MQFTHSRLLHAVCFLFAFALTVSASPVLNERASLQCSARNIAIVRRTVLDETHFCKWWLSDIRTRSPFLEFTPEQVTKLCRCVVATPSKPKREATEPLLEKRQTKASCSAEVSIQFTQPWRFCKFYTAYPRTTSPFQKYSATRLLNLCKCAISKAALSSKTSSSTKSRSSSTLSKTSSRKTSSIMATSSNKQTSSTLKPSASSSRPVSKSSSSSKSPPSRLSSSSSRAASKSSTSSILPASKSSASSSQPVSKTSSTSQSKSQSSSSTVKLASSSSTSSKLISISTKLVPSSLVSTKPLSSSSKASGSSAQSVSSSSSSRVSASSSSKSSLSSSDKISRSLPLPTISATSSAIGSSSKVSSGQPSLSRATTSLQPSVTASLPFCSVQSSAFEGNLARLAQASQYCSSLLRPTVSTVATSTKVVTITLPTVQGTATRFVNSTVESTVIGAKIETESVVIPVTVQSTATQTSEILDYIETTNIGATSVATVTEFTSSTVTLDTDSTPQAMVARDVEDSKLLVPDFWSGFSSTQLQQACDCILTSNSVAPTTVYSSTTIQTQTTTEMSSFDAETTSTVLITSLSTSTQTSTLRLNLTSTVSTRVSNYTVTSIRNATYTISSDTSATTTQHVTELTTYSSIYVPTPTASDIPAVALSQPTAIAGNVNGAPYDIDDQVFGVSLPVALTLYGQSSSNVQVSSNAVLGLGSIDASYTPEPLLYSYFSGPTVLGLWTDLYIYQGTQQGIYYQVSGSAPSRQTTFEFYISFFRVPSAYYHFLIKFAEDKPNIVTYQYLDVSDHGSRALVGVQDNNLNQFLQYSYDQSVICPGMQITFDTTPGRGSYKIDTPGQC